jgi:hypothetical protein
MEKKLQFQLEWKIFSWFETKQIKGWWNLLVLVDDTSLKKTTYCDTLPSHGVKPTWGFHKVKLRKVETWRHAPDFQL